ncbi:TIGR02680 family protein [Actinomadura sp. LOL_016]|uniref:TIGR02680 family protein n=1 Tax=unclassified Actinomadura TaxID=2626254 RepID=UPI003A80CD14
MTTRLRPSTPGSRFRLHRAGIRNVWQYDEQEFEFGDGRLLLRGKNGAGKSKALEMLLPYLLDGDSRALDATGTGRTTLGWLMLDGFESTNRLGYLWVEFRMSADGEDRYLTFGAAVRASKSTKRAVPFFFTTPLRVGSDLSLVDAGGAPLPVERLKGVVGAGNVTDRAVEHRARVARELFGINDVTRYRNLTQLLHRLRRPTVGDRIESGGLASLLSETLPGLDDDVVEKVARNLHDLDTVREELGRLERTDQALGTFLQSYAGYLAGVLHRAADDVTGELEALTARRREAGDAAKRTAGLRDAEKEARGRLDTLLQRERDARGELHALQTSPAYLGLKDLRELRETVDARRDAAGTAFTALGTAHDAEEDAAVRLGEGAGQLGGRFGELAAEHRELLSRAERAGLPAGHLGEAVGLPRVSLGGVVDTELTGPGGEVRKVRHGPVAAVDAAAAESGLSGWAARLDGAVPVARRRARMVGEVVRLFDAADEAGAAADRADGERERLEGEAEDAAAALERARGEVVEESRGYAREVNDWVERTLADAGPGCPPLDDVRNVVDRDPSPDAPFDERTLPPDVERRAKQVAFAALAPFREMLDAQRDGAAREVDRLTGERDRLDRERADWEALADPEPPVPPHRTAARAPRTGAPFYRLVTFADGLSPAERAGLEAALEASGVLDAWVTADGALLDPLTRDTVLRPEAVPPDGPTLAAALRPVPEPETGVTAGRVERVLAAFAFAPAAETAAVNAVHHDGSWRLGAVHGRHRKDDAEYVGAAVRAETRRRKLAELAERLADANRRLADERVRLTRLEDRRRAALDAEHAFPGSRLPVAWNGLDTARAKQRELSGRAADAARRAAQARADAVRARGEAEAAATAHDLPADRGGLGRAGVALDSLVDRIGSLGRAVRGTAEGLARDRADRGRYEDAHRARLAAEDEYRARSGMLRAAERRLGTLEETIGSSEEELLARERAAKDLVDGIVRLLPDAGRDADGLRDGRVRAEEEEGRLLGELAKQQDAVIAVGGVLRRALVRPEVVHGAGMDRASLPAQLGDDPGADARSRIQALRGLAGAVRTNLARPKADVSDSALLNRHTELRDQLAGGYDAQLEEDDGIKVCRLVDDHGSHDVARVGARIAQRAAEARGRLTEREGEVFQRFLTGELGDHLSTQVITAENLVTALNDTLRTVRTSHGLGVELQWKLGEDVDADVRAAVELLRSPASLRPREQTERLREVLHRRIEDARRADPAAGYAAHLRAALDYREWFRFHTFVVEDANPGRKRRLTGRTGLSQGEQRVLSYLVLFAAAAAHFTTLGGSAPHAPRLILLDDAFAKVDEPTHGRLGRILVDLDLDFVLTSERLMGNWPEVPSLHIYECLRDPHSRGVATLHYTWDGRHRRLAAV